MPPLETRRKAGATGCAGPISWSRLRGNLRCACCI